MTPFPVLPRTDTAGVSHLGTLDVWLRHAGPAKKEGHWKSGRSSMEMAKAWRFGLIPPEVAEGLSGTPFETFQPREGRVEFKSYFDGRGPRNHDLVLFGQVGGADALIDIEGKADEKFGEGYVGKLRSKLTKGKVARIGRLRRAMFGPDAPEAIADDVPYQLLYGVYATVALAKLKGCQRALFLVQVFTNETCSLQAVKRGRQELGRLARLIDAAGRAPTRADAVVGPVKAHPGSTWLSAGPELWIGRVETWQGRMAE